MRVYCQIILVTVVMLSNSFTTLSAEITTSNGLISIQAENESLNRVMKSLGQALGCEVTMPAISKKVSISRTHAELKSVFRELLNGYQHVVYWSHDPAGKDMRVDKILVLSAAREDLSGAKKNSQLIFYPKEPVVLDSADARIDNLINMAETNEWQQSLRLALQDTSPDVRLVALDILFSLGNAEAKQMIQPSLGDPDSKVREAAREMLADLDATSPNQ